MRFVNVRELKSKTSEILRAAASEDIIITNHGKPVAVVSGIDGRDFERIPARFGKGRIAEKSPSWGMRERQTESDNRHPPPSFVPSWGEPTGKDPDVGADCQRVWNPLKAVFWDYPELTDEPTLKAFLSRAKENPEKDSLDWALTRLLERGRVIDVKKLFDWKEIRAALIHLRLSVWARAKWQRMIDVYDRT